VRRHLDALAAEPELAALYRGFAAELLRLDLGHAPETVQALRDLLSGPAA
jgi:hypothetical protein